VSDLPHRWICSNPECGYDGFHTGDLKSPAGFEVSVAYFCPACKHALYRDDPLGELEREAFGSPKFPRPA
jgi:hypothetical protein